MNKQLSPWLFHSVPWAMLQTNQWRYPGATFDRGYPLQVLGFHPENTRKTPGNFCWWATLNTTKTLQTTSKKSGDFWIWTRNLMVNHHFHTFSHSFSPSKYRVHPKSLWIYHHFTHFHIALKGTSKSSTENSERPFFPSPIHGRLSEIPIVARPGHDGMTGGALKNTKPYPYP